jgi:hypothetical protein
MQFLLRRGQTARLGRRISRSPRHEPEVSSAGAAQPGRFWIRMPGIKVSQHRVDLSRLDIVTARLAETSPNLTESYFVNQLLLRIKRLPRLTSAED